MKNWRINIKILHQKLKIISIFVTLVIDFIASIEAECLKSCYQSHRRTCSVKHMNCNEMHSTGRQSRFFSPVRIFSYSPQLHLYISSIIQKPPLFTSNAIISPATYLPLHSCLFFHRLWAFQYPLYSRLVNIYFCCWVDFGREPDVYHLCEDITFFVLVFMNTGGTCETYFTKTITVHETIWWFMPILIYFLFHIYYLDILL